ncbi:RNA-binding S4 domain-containing protein [Anaerovibrio sp.]|uniref:RNA-binding S4 domain-containing protein n=1 Tax=Anaerovibrio sp. TaxID=1872532 RepID=UPI0025B9DCBD|nr:RNA-binding S4 domain-containing protein [Anaerovibrio sp.]MBR2141653.1 RNA-binding S4 domain-containing protein [Anaerovibrio sp.]
MEKIEITTETIQLDQFLKWAGVIESGGQVKNMIENELIYVNDVLEKARRKKLKNSDVVRISNVGSWQVVFKGER